MSTSEQQQGQWQPVPGGGAPFWKAKAVGDEISGKIVGKRSVPGLEPGKMQDVLDVMTPEGEVTLAMTADLKRKVGGQPIGTLFKAKYIGTKKIKGKPSPMKEYSVQVYTGGA